MQNEDRQKAEMRQRFYSHKFWPLLSKRFYYLTEAEIFKAMVKGKGNLRDISSWLAENIPLQERLGQYDRQKQEQRVIEERIHREMLAKQQEEFLKRHEELQYQMAQEAAHGIVAQPDWTMQVNLPQIYDDEDMSPVKRGMARDKDVMFEEKQDLPSTKVEFQKPKVSILEKYRNRVQTQLRIDSLLDDSAQPKKRRLVRADMTGPPGLFPQVPTLEAGMLTAAYGYLEQYPINVNGMVMPPAPTTTAAEDELDQLEALEEKIRQNKRKLKPTADSDADLDEDEFSDDMSGEDEGDMYGSGITSIDGQILEFLNNATVEDIIEICNVQPKVANILISKRPFATIYEVAEQSFQEATPEPEAKKRNNKKAMGLKIVESTEFSLKGYKAVDSLIKKCSEFGNLISRQMDRWGVKVTGEGELDMVDIAVDEDEEDDGIRTTTRSLPYIKHKPTLLAPDIDLKNYQQVGINWLNLLYQNKLSCILADEMGLGKTCQVISFMAYLKATSDSSRSHMVVVPSSTLENWLREFKKFCPDLVVQAYYGSQAEREELRYELQEMHYDVLVTTYNLATGSLADFKFLRRQHFDMVVYDEGHLLKNSNSERYNKLMRMTADFRLLLTGTPLQNNLKELVSLLAFMLPDLFVEKREDLQGLFNKKASVDVAEGYNPLLSQQAIMKAKTMMTPFVLRRKKAQVLKHLPAKSHQIIKCELTPLQREIYDRYIEQGKASRLERERRKKMSPKEAQASKKNDVSSSSNVLMSLRKASMHPLLFRTLYTDALVAKMATKIMKEPEYVEANRKFIIEDMSVMSDYELNSLCEKFSSTLGSHVLEEDKWLDSGKVSQLMEIIKGVIERKEKVLVFSLFTQMLDILEKVLSFSNIAFVRLDGQTSVDTRQDIIDRFYEDKDIPVFLLSTKAGGFGINLVAANNVVIFDQSFNPHDDKQAEDRAHRVGQTSEVLVTKLISENTIDENILLLADNKLQLDQSISNEGNESKFEEKAASMFEKILFG